MVLNSIKFQIYLILTLLISCGVILNKQDDINDIVVVFFSNDLKIQTITFQKGELIVAPKGFNDPCYSKIVGWYKDSEFNQEFDFEETIVSDITLYAKWEGDREEPIGIHSFYQICNWKQLQWIAGGNTNIRERKYRLGLDYKLIKDISFPDPGIDDFPEYGFIPIGYNVGIISKSFQGNPFTGTLDGDGFTIKNFFINTDHSNWNIVNGIYPNQVLNNQYVGLFGQINSTNASVKNLTLIMRPISDSIPYGVYTENNYAGGLVGELKRGTLSNVSVQGSGVYGNWNVGGLVGNNGGIVSGFFVEEVAGNKNVGGLAGRNQGTVIGFATGIVSGITNIGGLVGYSSTGVVIGTNFGSVSGKNDVGGLVGYNKGTVFGTNFKPVSGNNNIGGLVGSSVKGEINGYVNNNVGGDNNIGGLVGHSIMDKVTGYFEGNVTGSSSNIGGLVGNSIKSTIVSYETGAVSGQDNVGGLVGSSVGSTIMGYGTGTISGQDNVGGLVGNSVESTIVGYKTGTVLGQENFDSLVAVSTGNEVTGYWDMSISKQINGIVGIGISATRNIIFNNGYIDSAYNRNIFDQEIFTTIFDTDNGKSKTWPQLRNFPFSQPRIDDADFSPSTHSIILNYRGGVGSPEQMTVTAGDKITPQATHPCYNFGGWFTDDTLTTEFGGVVFSDLTLYAKWDGVRIAPIDINGKYQICKWQQLQWIAGGEASESERESRLGYNYKLITNIIFPDPGQDGFPEYGFIPIGYSTGTTANSFQGNPFTGSFDGNSKTISNFYMDATHIDWSTAVSNQNLDNEYIGLFGQVNMSFGEIKDLKMVLRQTNNLMPHSITTMGNNVGGLVGQLKSGTLKDVTVMEGGIRGVDNVGGIVGDSSGEIVGFSTIDVLGENYVGGLVGKNNNNSITGYAIGTVIGNDKVGGLVGYNDGSITGYATGSVKGGEGIVGGLIGNNTGDGVIGYWDIDASGQESSGDGMGISSTRNIEFSNGIYSDIAYDRDIFSEHDFGIAFDIDNGPRQTWPQLRNFPFDQPTINANNFSSTVHTITFDYGEGRGNIRQMTIVSGQKFDLPQADHSCYNLAGWYTNGELSQKFGGVAYGDLTLYVKWEGDREDPSLLNNIYQICNWKQLQWIAEDTSRFSNDYILTDNINLPNPGEDGFPEWGFVPIGYSTGGTSNVFFGIPFTGTFDGNNNIISNFYIDATHVSWDYAISNQTLSKNYIGLFGRMDSSSAEVKNLKIILRQTENSMSDSIKTEGDYVGGLVGELKNGTLNNVTVMRGKIQGVDNVGGIAGSSSGSIIGFSTTEVSGTMQVGGLIGLNTGNVTGYAIGSVSGSENVAGLVGSGSSGAIVGYSTGNVIGDGINIGGLVGISTIDSTIVGYWDVTASGKTESAGGTGISATKNILYNEGYTDSAYNNNIFNDIFFTTAFNTDNGPSQTWPQLRNFPFDQPVISAADFTLSTHTITFDYRGGIGDVNQITVNSAEPVDIPQPKHLCYNFAGWFENSALIDEFSGLVFSDLTLYAKWEGYRVDPIALNGVYQICNWKQLQWIAGGNTNINERINRLGYNYKLVMNIEFPVPGLEEFPTYGFIPIGYDIWSDANTFEGEPFTGTFDGNNKTISNLFIDATISTWPNAIGQSLDNQYIGLFGQIDGENAQVKDLKINLRLNSSNFNSYSIKTRGNYVGGLVGQLKRGNLNNVAVIGGRVWGNNHVGGLIGRTTGETVNGYATGDVLGNGDNVGGLVGSIAGSTVIGYATGDVSGSENVGGLVGGNYGRVTGYATGDVLSSSVGNNLGGLIGIISGGTATGYATGSVTGRGENIGGFAGENYGSLTGYATGMISASGNNVGGLVGLMGENAGSVIGYWDMAFSRLFISSAGTGISATRNIIFENGYIDIIYDRIIFNETIFIDSFNTTGTSQTWPQLRNFPFDQPVVNANSLITSSQTLTFDYRGGSGNKDRMVVDAGDRVADLPQASHPCNNFAGWFTDSTLTNAFDGVVYSDLTLYAKWEGDREDPSLLEDIYQICNWKQLQWIAKSPDRLNDNYVLITNINFPEPNGVNFPEYGFIPIGYDTGVNTDTFSGTSFTGTFDGAGYTINNLFINADHSSWTTTSIYQELTLDDEYIGLFGQINHTNAEIKNLIIVLRPTNNNVPSSIKTGGNYVGGLVGELRNGTLSNIIVMGGRIQGYDNVGGLVGSSSGTINSYSTATVSGNNNIGGLIGENSGTVTGYATGTVSGNGFVGGLIGENSGTVTGYATGAVSGNSFVGGLVGNNMTGQSLIVGYALGSVIGNDENTVGGVLGGNKGREIIGYWDLSIFSQSNFGTGVSATSNIMYINNFYTDEGNDITTPIFFEAEFINAFDTNNGTSRTWPKLKATTLPQPNISDEDEDGSVEIAW